MRKLHTTQDCKGSSKHKVLLTLTSTVLAYLAMTVYTQMQSIEEHKGTAYRIIEFGYPAEEHTVSTEDGYLLHVIRIPHGRVLNSDGKHLAKPVVLLQHGMFCSSDTWITSMNMSLAYLLADAGYDVWLGNARGNTYSRKHQTLFATQPEFWQFSFHELGYYDVAAQIDFILQQTQQKSLHFISYSQGATSFLVLISEKPDYQEKLRTSHLLSPAAYLLHTSLPMVHLAKYMHYDSLLGQLLSRREFFSNATIWVWLCQQLCSTESKLHGICSGILGSVGGDWHLNQTLLPTFCATNPAGVSTNQLFHYGQVFKSGRFQKFDFGSKLNMKYYNQSTPPEYQLKHIKHCTKFYYGDNDLAAAYADIKYLANKLPCVKLWRVPKEDWNHYDFIWGDNVDKLLYSHIIKDLNDFEMLRQT